MGKWRDRRNGDQEITRGKPRFRTPRAYPVGPSISPNSSEVKGYVIHQLPLKQLSSIALFPLRFGNSKIRETIAKAPVLLFRLRQYHTHILSLDSLLPVNLNIHQCGIQSLKELRFDLSSASRRQEHVYEDMFVGTVQIEIIPREEKLVWLMLRDDLEVVSLEDREMRYHSLMNRF